MGRRSGGLFHDEVAQGAGRRGAGYATHAAGDAKSGDKGRGAGGRQPY